MPYLIDIGKCYSFKQKTITKNRMRGFGYDLYKDTITRDNLLPNAQYALPSGDGTRLAGGTWQGDWSSWSREYTNNLFNWVDSRQRLSVTYTVYYKTYTIPSISSLNEIVQDWRNIEITFTYTAGNREITATPNFQSALPSAPIILGSGELDSNATALLGRTNVNIVWGANSFTINVTVITSVTRSSYWDKQRRNVFFGIPGGAYSAGGSGGSSDSRNLDLPFWCQVYANIIVKTKEEISVGDNNDEMYTIRDNQILTDTATFTDNNGTVPLMAQIAADISRNYGKGKSLVFFSYPLIDIEHTTMITGTNPDDTVITDTPPPIKDMSRVNYITFKNEFGNYEFLQTNENVPIIYEMQSVQRLRNKWVCTACEMK